MARGWESKSIESQQDEADRERLAARGRPLTDAERAIAERRRGLELARAKTAADLEAAPHARHREMLRAALAAIDQQLCALADEPQP
jgi:hypothetical protein